MSEPEKTASETTSEDERSGATTMWGFFGIVARLLGHNLVSVLLLAGAAFLCYKLLELRADEQHQVQQETEATIKRAEAEVEEARSNTLKMYEDQIKEYKEQGSRTENFLQENEKLSDDMLQKVRQSIESEQRIIAVSNLEADARSKFTQAQMSYAEARDKLIIANQERGDAEVAKSNAIQMTLNAMISMQSFSNQLAEVQKSLADAQKNLTNTYVDLANAARRTKSYNDKFQELTRMIIESDISEASPLRKKAAEVLADLPVGTPFELLTNYFSNPDTNSAHRLYGLSGVFKTNFEATLEGCTNFEFWGDLETEGLSYCLVVRSAGGATYSNILVLEYDSHSAGDPIVRIIPIDYVAMLNASAFAPIDYDPTMGDEAWENEPFYTNVVLRVTKYALDDRVYMEAVRSGRQNWFGPEMALGFGDPFSNISGRVPGLTTMTVSNFISLNSSLYIQEKTNQLSMLSECVEVQDRIKTFSVDALIGNSLTNLPADLVKDFSDLLNVVVKSDSPPTQLLFNPAQYQLIYGASNSWSWSRFKCAILQTNFTVLGGQLVDMNNQVPLNAGQSAIDGANRELLDLIPSGTIAYKIRASYWFTPPSTSRMLGFESSRSNNLVTFVFARRSDLNGWRIASMKID